MSGREVSGFVCFVLALVASTIFIFIFTFQSTLCSELLGLIQEDVILGW